MSNLLNRFYFLSKLGTSLILLFGLLFICYLFIETYLEQNNIKKSKIKMQDISLQIESLANIVEQNSSNINSIKDLVIENKKSVSNITVKLKDSKNNKEILEKIDMLANENKKINNKIILLFDSVNNKKNIVANQNESNSSYQNLNNIIKFIYLKLENGKKFEEEIELLKMSSLNARQESNIDKLLILSSKNFYGYNELIEKYDNISSQYLNNYFFKDKNNYITKNLANLIMIQPNMNTKIEDNTVYLLAQVKRDLTSKNIKDAIQKLYLLQNSASFFDSWIKDAELYAEIENILDNFVK